MFDSAFYSKLCTEVSTCPFRCFCPCIYSHPGLGAHRILLIPVLPKPTLSLVFNLATGFSSYVIFLGWEPVVFLNSPAHPTMQASACLFPLCSLGSHHYYGHTTLTSLAWPCGCLLSGSPPSVWLASSSNLIRSPIQITLFLYFGLYGPLSAVSLFSWFDFQGFSQSIAFLHRCAWRTFIHHSDVLVIIASVACQLDALSLSPALS